MFCRIKDVNTFTCNICFSKMCVYLCFSTPYIIYQPVYCSGSDAQTTMSQRREDLKAGDIRSCLNGRFSSSTGEMPACIRHIRELRIFLGISPCFSDLPPFIMLFVFFMSVYITHSLPLHAPIFSPPARCCEPGFLPSILPPLWVCIGGETHLPTRNDIIVLIGSQSDGSTWSPAFRGALCTQERQRGEGGKKESLKWISGQTEAYTGTEG